ncbi:MAG: lipoprotein signal peptidase [Cytophagales bacterium]|nr:lipoprotein signal peptidase [Cytophagales bacterium]
MKKLGNYYAIALSVILIDQCVKLWVHSKMLLGTAGEIPIFGEWFRLHYTLNPGMAFGIELGEYYGKLFLTCFRLLAGAGMAFIIFRLAKENASRGLLVSIALILGGALGNVADSVFYGVFLHNAPYGSPSPWFHGQVIDMFYVDIWSGTLPDWLPLWGGQYVALWPIFNIADAAIFIGVMMIILFQKQYFKAIPSYQSAA